MANNPEHLRPKHISIRGLFNYYAFIQRLFRKSVFCFQVGANDGKHNDPVNKYFTHYNWTGLLIEPQLDVFQEGLSKTYQNNNNVILENLALSPTTGELPFYRVAFSKERWATGLSSFCRENIIEHIENGYIQKKAMADGIDMPSDIEKIIETVKVATMSVDDLFRKHNVRKMDVLCIDTEGYDFEILKLIDFQKYQPQLVLFESKNLSDNDFTEAKNLLMRNDYQLFWEKGDTLAIKFKFPYFVKLVLKSLR